MVRTEVGEQQIVDIETKYGRDNIRVDDVAYDCDRHIISQHKAVFIRREAVSKKHV